MATMIRDWTAHLNLKRAFETPMVIVSYVSKFEEDEWGWAFEPI